MEGRKCWSRDRDNVVKVQLNGKEVGVRGGGLVDEVTKRDEIIGGVGRTSEIQSEEIN